MDQIQELLWAAKYPWGHPHTRATFPWDRALTRAWEARVQAWDMDKVPVTPWEAPALSILA